ncbi:Unknown protein sequence [Pseudomonas syringae pv. maculicola]|nr:Unknown protein sequence [Pseudomonas syringae pv. maculicola]KPB90553.1 Unknown protein sequence [Pseudomonas syringae pv. maculicola]KPB94016.1 Unknown protein sequence [Pseudomonas syringae pv. maculicola]KPC13053.1 Unknown protein sequence [Pseudomonas amygdali pv. lachrymans]
MNSQRKHRLKQRRLRGWFRSGLYDDQGRLLAGKPVDAANF